MTSNTDIKRDLGLVGAGYWGKNLARNFNALGVLRTLCDRNPDVLSAYGSEYSDTQKTDSFDALLNDQLVTKVAIAAPAALHFKLAKAALLAGKDVYVEKPLCLDISEAEELVRLADLNSRMLMVGHLLQYHPCILRIRDLISRGELGRLQYITSNRLNLGKIRQEENALWSFAPHDISVILSLLANALPEQVRCVGGSYLTPQVADTTLTMMRFPGQVRAHVYVSWLNPFKEQKLTVVGSAGMVVFDDTKAWNEKLVMHRDYLTWSDGRTPTPGKIGGSPVVVDQEEPLRNECMHFVECCRDRSTPRTDGREGLRVLRVLKAAQSSLERDGESASPVVGLEPRYFVHPSAIVDSGAVVGDGTKIWHFSHIMAGAQIGSGCNLGQNVVVSSGVRLGRNVKVQNNVSIYTGAEVEDDVFLGPSCVLTNVTNPRSQICRRSLYEKTIIRRGATIGANATIVCGVVIGRYAFVAAGAVVTSDVPDYALIQGVPGKQVGWMSRHGHKLRANPAGELRCPESGLRYAEDSVGALRCLDCHEDEDLPSELSKSQMAYDELKVNEEEPRQ